MVLIIRIKKCFSSIEVINSKLPMIFGDSGWLEVHRWVHHEVFIFTTMGHSGHPVHTNLFVVRATIAKFTAHLNFFLLSTEKLNPHAVERVL